MPWSWLSLSKQILIRSFKWGTVSSCRLRGWKNTRGHIGLESGRVSNSLSTCNFDLWYFFSLLTYKNVQYFIWKIWFISVWRMKAKAMAWLLTWFMITQSTLISYHTEAFVKTEVACTAYKWELPKSNMQRNSVLTFLISEHQFSAPFVIFDVKTEFCIFWCKAELQHKGIWVLLRLHLQISKWDLP